MISCSKRPATPSGPIRGCISMVETAASQLHTGVRFSSPAPTLKIGLPHYLNAEARGKFAPLRSAAGLEIADNSITGWGLSPHFSPRNRAGFTFAATLLAHASLLRSGGDYRVRLGDVRVARLGGRALVPLWFCGALFIYMVSSAR